MIQIKCKTGYSLPLKDFRLYSGKLKKHSMLEIERVVDSIINDGFLFPISVMKIEDKNYIVDGEATYKALCELEDRGFELPEIPITYIESDNIKKAILIGTSTNHCVTEISLKEFVKDTNIDLESFGFNEGELISFFNRGYFDELFGKYKTDKLISKKYEDFITGGLI